MQLDVGIQDKVAVIFIHRKVPVNYLVVTRCSEFPASRAYEIILIRTILIR